ncbi:ras and EF-hand domain-containing protein-like [Petromyzon marinus]|uniref:ras and EF-hand domain-containing protein-like n=1 Tax=Petromyzon marinus TaxID=7757 RepID=UPI003F6EE8F6
MGEFSDRMYKLIFMGDASVGKTSLMMRLCRNEFRANMSSTLGVDSHVKTVTINEKQLTLQLWDTAGQERFRSIAQTYFRRADGVLLVFDCTHEGSFLNVREWLLAVEDAAGRKLPTVLVGNKVDMRDTCLKYGKKCVMPEDGKRLAKEYNAIYIETSAKQGTNVQDAVELLAKQVLAADIAETKAMTLQLGGDVSVDGAKGRSGSCCTPAPAST